MRARILVMTAAVLVSCAAYAGSAHALPTEDGATSSGTEEAPLTADAAAETETVVGPIEYECGAGGSTSTAVAARLTLAAEVDCVRHYSCRRVAVARVQKSVTGLFVVFKFWHWIRWCWKDNRVFDIATGQYLTDVSSTMIYRGIVSSWADYYEWCCRIWNSGYVTHRQIRMENCVLSRCIGSWHPWVRIRADADGTFTFRVGN